MKEADAAGATDGAIALPLRPGEEHAILFGADALRFARSVNYAVGDDILLHLVVRPADDALIVNDLLDGRWGAEQRLPLAGAGGPEGLHVRVAVTGDGFRIGLGEATVLAFQARRGMAAAAELRSAPGITIGLPGQVGPPAGPAPEPRAPSDRATAPRPALPRHPAAPVGDENPAADRFAELERRAAAQEARLAALEASLARAATTRGASGGEAGAELARIPAALLEGVGLQDPASAGQDASRWLGRHAALVLRQRVPAQEIILRVATMAPGLDRERLFCTLNGVRAPHRWEEDGFGHRALRVAVPEGADIGGMVGVLRLSFDAAPAAPGGTIACAGVSLQRRGAAGQSTDHASAGDEAEAG